MAANARGKHSRKPPKMTNNGFSEKPRNNRNVTTFPVETADQCRSTTPSEISSMMAPNRFSQKPRSYQNVPAFPFGPSGNQRPLVTNFPPRIQHHVQPPQNRAQPPHNHAQPPQNRAQPSQTGAQPPHNRAQAPQNRAQPPQNRAQPPQNRAQLPHNHAQPPHNRSPPFENFDLLEVVKAIQMELRCCGCRSPLRTARLCLNGHGVCPDCKRRGDNLCPKCKVPTMNENLAIVENIIKLLPKVCEFAKSGCEMLLLENDYDHEKFCRFRYTHCEMRECTWLGPAKGLMVHLEDKHSKDLVRTAKKTQILIDFDCTVDKMSAVPILAFNNVFWQHTVVKNKQLLQFYRYVPMGKPTKAFSVFVSFHTPENKRSFFTPVHSDAIKLEELEKHSRTFCLTKEDTVAFHRFYSGVQYTFEVTESKI